MFFNEVLILIFSLVAQVYLPVTRPVKSSRGDESRLREGERGGEGYTGRKEREGERVAEESGVRKQREVERLQFQLQQEKYQGEDLKDAIKKVGEGSVARGKQHNFRYQFDMFILKTYSLQTLTLLQMFPPRRGCSRCR